ncbi:uncharacterized protein LOC123275263 [Cotesia glomerata]|uniref:uncharacterized protein LOC123275263 n=1 Tax=Cotesia glomerata TaxID=32391 RepID=UPI001D00D416|nr:uncharacterized protein LOC123275263 [Cotesia glomerata]
MNIFDKPCYKIAKDFVTLIGRWPYMPRMRRLIMITILWIVFLLEAIPQIIAMVIHSNDRKILLEALSAFAVHCLFFNFLQMRFAELLEECYAMSFGVLVGLNLPMISLTGFQIITQSNTVQQILKGLTFIAGQMLHLFFDCYMSQKLNDSSSQIAQSIANVNWYKQSIRSQKLLVVMTVRSQVPCKLTAGKVMDLSIENFAKMLKTAGSYFTMLLSMQ